jgi:O-antigen ligase
LGPGPLAVGSAAGVADSSPSQTTERSPRGLVVAVLAALVAVVGVIGDSGSWFPLLSTRWLFLVGTAVALVPAVLVGLARHRRMRFQRGLLAAWLAMGVALALGAAAAPSLHQALVGAMDRRDGLLSWLARAMWCGAALAVVRDRRDLRVLARGVVVGLAGVVLVTIAQQRGWNWPANAVNRARPGGPLGNANLLGADAALTVPVAIGLARDAAESRRWRRAATAAAAGGTLVLVASGTRGAWMGAGLGLVVAGVLWRRVSARRASLAKPLIAAVVVAVVAVAALGVGDRVLNAGGGTAAGRVDTWAVAVRAIGERPWTGWGPDGAAAGLQRHIDDRYEQSHTRRLLPDRAHSLPLDIGLSFGLVGLAAFGALIAVAGRRTWVGARAVATPTGFGVLAGVVALLGAELTLFPVPEVDSLAWLLAGALMALGAAHHVRSPVVGGVTRRRLAILGISGTALLVAGVALPTAVAGWRADRAARVASDQLALGKPVAALAAAHRSLELDPGQTMPALLLAQAAQLSGDVTVMSAAVGQLESVRRRSVDDGRLILAEGAIVKTCGSRCDDLRPSLRARAQDLVHRDPARADGWRLVAELAEDAAAPDEAVAARRRVVELAPNSERALRELISTQSRYLSGSRRNPGAASVR